VTTKTPAKRQADKRARRALLGLVRLEMWVRPEHAAQVKAYAARLANPTNEAEIYWGTESARQDL
jgi:hypothetical protein